MDRFLSRITQIAFLVLCVVGIAVGTRSLLLPHAVTVAIPDGSATARRPAPPVYQRGERISVPGIDFARSSKTLVLVTREGCKFCDASMPFYKTLTTDPNLIASAKVVFIGPEDVNVHRDALARQGVRADQVVSVGLETLKIAGTPTAIIANTQGVVERIFVGLLDETRQQQLIAALRSAQ